MSYNVEITKLFKKQSKKLIKKFPSFKLELTELILSLELEPTQGTSLGNNNYKIRIAIASKNKGKSGGARAITHVHVVNTTVYLLSIYDKSEQEDITDKEIARWLDDID